MGLRELLIGRPLKSEEEQNEQIGPLMGVPVLGLDALASAAYGPEAALTVLLPLGIVASLYMGPITLGILGVLFAVYFSYRQTIAAYPSGGGSFTVAKENLGPLAGLVAAAALCVDYILNVAVAIAAGVGALVSAIPALFPHTLTLCLGLLAALTIVNLRGIRTAGLLLWLPTYLFTGCLFIVFIAGLIKTILAGGHPVPVVPPPQSSPPLVAMAGTWLILHAFASGCTALTGIEAVSNGVPLFRKPTVKLAQRALGLLVLILALLLACEALLSRLYHVHATVPGQVGYQSILSQIVAAVAGRGFFYYLTMFGIIAVLCLSANTSFADFPRVCRLLALDEYLPADFAHRGSRLVYSYGIMALSILSGSLLVLFEGVTDRLIPLFAIGAFSAFTLSQAGMVMHWWRRRDRGWLHSLILNGIGAIATFATLIIIAIMKFKEGAWITILVLPILVILFLRIRHYQEAVASDTGWQGPLDTSNVLSPIIVVPLKRLDGVGRKALRLALRISNEVYAVQVLSEEAMQTENLEHDWNDLVQNPARAAGYNPPPKLIVIPSEYREFFGPFMNFVYELAQQNPGRPIGVMVSEVVEKRWYNFLFRHRATLLKALLLMKGDPQIFVVDAPWYVQERR